MRTTFITAVLASIALLVSAAPLPHNHGEHDVHPSGSHYEKRHSVTTAQEHHSQHSEFQKRHHTGEGHPHPPHHHHKQEGSGQGEMPIAEAAQT
ncbi:hypothetical protein FRC19_007415 [Serendipita sp. 401]|nr:hypothetical protein FRC19_007415 [Serendipita sp. 401]KAG9052485.1 hypothetical protein FS842_009786 [Serendipita sp. 407]